MGENDELLMRLIHTLQITVETIGRDIKSIREELNALKKEDVVVAGDGTESNTYIP